MVNWGPFMAMLIKDFFVVLHQGWQLFILFIWVCDQLAAQVDWKCMCKHILQLSTFTAKTVTVAIAVAKTFNTFCLRVIFSIWVTSFSGKGQRLFSVCSFTSLAFKSTDGWTGRRGHVPDEEDMADAESKETRNQFNKFEWQKRIISLLKW